MSYARISRPTALRLPLAGLAGGATLALLAMAAPAAAAICTANPVTYTLTQSSPDAVRDVTCMGGNDDDFDARTIFGLTGWQTAHYVGSPLGSSPDVIIAGGNAPFFSLAPSAGTQQRWEIDNTGGFVDLVVVLKQGPTFAAFLLDATAPLSGLWGTAGPGGSVGALAHTTLWYRPDGARLGQTSAPCTGTVISLDTTNCRDSVVDGETDSDGVGVVPLPAAGWLLVGGLGLLGGLGWRKRRGA